MSTLPIPSDIDAEMMAWCRLRRLVEERLAAAPEDRWRWELDIARARRDFLRASGEAP